MVIRLDCRDRIIERSKNNKIAKNSKYITSFILYSGLSYMVLSGIIGIGFIFDCAIIGCANKITKTGIKYFKGTLK
jgi:hypothetical protein